jgi:hypothetical protein
MVVAGFQYQVYNRLVFSDQNNHPAANLIGATSCLYEFLIISRGKFIKKFELPNFLCGAVFCFTK